VDQGRALQPAEGPTKQTTSQLLKLAEVRQTNKRMFRAALLYGELRYVYKVPKEQTEERLNAWLAWASRSRLKPFVKLARTIRKHKQGVLAAVEIGISNGRLEALNSKVRLISHRAYGFHSADALMLDHDLHIRPPTLGAPAASS
jgi:transposase